ncbi:MAG: hypothetical protein U0401_25795 [Anaerolineae bacterium]
MADFVDIKSVFTLGHSSGVARLAAGNGHRAGFPAANIVTPAAGSPGA